MDRRRFLWQSSAAAAAIFAARIASAQTASGYRNLLVLVELKGGNDGLNTVVPYADPAYYTLRPRIGVRRDDVLQLDDRTGLHPALAPLLPIWQARELAIIQGVGYPEPNLSHFRSIEIWDTASRADEYLTDGWLARAFAAARPPPPLPPMASSSDRASSDRSRAAARARWRSPTPSSSCDRRSSPTRRRRGATGLSPTSSRWKAILPRPRRTSTGTASSAPSSRRGRSEMRCGPQRR